MRNCCSQKVNFGTLKSKKAKALVAQMEKNKFRRKPLVSRILAAGAVTATLIIAGVMLTKTKNVHEEKVEGEKPGKVQKNEKRKRVDGLRRVLRIRAQLKKRITWNEEEETRDLEQRKLEAKERVRELEEDLAALKIGLENINEEYVGAVHEAHRLFTIALNGGAVDVEADRANTRVLEDIRGIKGNTEQEIMRTEEEIEIEKTRIWLVDKDEDYLMNARHYALQTIANPAFSVEAVIEAGRTIIVIDELLVIRNSA